MERWILCAAIVAWLFICMIVDMRNRDLPLSLTLIPYLIASVLAAWQGCWPAALLAVLVILISDLRATIRLPVFLLLLVLAYWLAPTPDGKWISLCVGLTWLVWDRMPQVLGGSDARVLITIALAFLSPPMFLYVLVGMGLVGLLFRLRKETPVPLVPGITVGMLAYLVLMPPSL